MTVPDSRRNPPSHPKVDATQLWPGGIATAVVAGLVAVVGVLACRWLLSVPILAPQRDGAYGDAHTTGVVLAAAGAALVATALLHLLLISTPRPLSFFGWIVGLATVVAVLLPFSTGAPLSQKIATGAVSLVIGIAIGTLLTGVAARSTRPGTGAGSRPPNPAEYPEIPGGYRTGRQYPADAREDATRPYQPQRRDQDR
jgi:hypothetical protein